MSTAQWRNGSASDSRSEGWEFESLCPHFDVPLARERELYHYAADTVNTFALRRELCTTMMASVFVCMTQVF